MLHQYFKLFSIRIFSLALKQNGHRRDDYGLFITESAIYWRNNDVAARRRNAFFSSRRLITPISLSFLLLLDDVLSPACWRHFPLKSAIAACRDTIFTMIIVTPSVKLFLIASLIVTPIRPIIAISTSLRRAILLPMRRTPTQCRRRCRPLHFSSPKCIYRIFS